MQTVVDPGLAGVPVHGLSADELSRFDTFGFLVLRGLFATEAGDLSAGFERVLAVAPAEVVPCGQFYAVAPSCDERPRVALFNVLDQDPDLAKLRNDARITGIVEQVVGGQYTAVDSVSLFNCETHWHNDGLFSTGGRNVLFLWYLDPLTAQTGALRVIPGSHEDGPFRRALQEELMRSDAPLSQAFGTKSDQLPAVPIDVEPGDAVLIDYDLFHASFGGGLRRRVITVGFGAARAGRQGHAGTGH